MSKSSVVILIVLAASVGVGACKPSSSSSSPEASEKPLAVAAAAAAPAAAPAGADETVAAALPASAPSEATKKHVKKPKGPPTTVVSFEDPTTTSTKHATACFGEKVSVIVPDGLGDWKATTHASLGVSTHDIVKGWLGPNTDGEKFTWSTAKADLNYPDDFKIQLEAPSEHLKVTVTLDVQPCDDDR